MNNNRKVGIIVGLALGTIKVIISGLGGVFVGYSFGVSILATFIYLALHCIIFAAVGMFIDWTYKDL